MYKFHIKHLALYFVCAVCLFLFIQKPLFILLNMLHGVDDLSVSDIWPIYSHGLRLDVASSCYMCALPWLLCLIQYAWKRMPIALIWRVYNGVIATLLALISLADAALYEFWEFKLDSTVFMYLGDPKNAAASVSMLYIVAHAVAWIVLAFVMYKLLDCTVRRMKVNKSPRRWWHIVSHLLLGGLLFAGIRGLSVWPNNPGVAFYTNQQFCNHAALNPAFNIMYSLTRRQDFGKEFRSMDDEECDRVFAPMFPTEGVTQDTLLKTQRPDILVIVTEGMGAIFVESLTGKKPESVAVCLDSLTREGVNFTHCYCSSFRTDRGIVATLSGYPGQPTTSIMRYTGKVQSLPGLPAVLREAGYETQVLYSSDVTFFNMSNYFLCCGHDRIISQDDFPAADRTTKWGVPDHIAFEWLHDDLLQKHAKGVSPSYTTMLTVSSHNPFDVPAFHRHEDVQLNAFAYTDSCIGHFIRSIEKTPVWDNLLIIITADHGYNWRPVDSPDFAQIPFIMLGGVIKEPRQIETIMCQTDLPATLLGQLGLPHSQFSFSRDVLADTYTEPMAINSWNNGFTLFDTTGCTVYDNVAGKALHGDDAERIRRGKAFLQTLYNDLDKR